MGKVLSVIAAKAQRFNVENRADRVISQSKPVAAPKFESNIKDLERVIREHPEYIAQAGKKDTDLDDRLKQVFVTSSDYLEQRRYINPDKPLPTKRGTVEDFELGFQEPDLKKVSIGRCTLRQAIQFISDHQQNPNEWTAERISNEFKLKKENTDNILQFFRLFAVHIPDVKGPTKKILMDPFDGKSKNFNAMLDEYKGQKLPPKEP